MGRSDVDGSQVGGEKRSGEGRAKRGDVKRWECQSEGALPPAFPSVSAYVWEQGRSSVNVFMQHT